jgi:hypothetical protein
MENKKCAHAICTCNARQGDNYCSDHCAKDTGVEPSQGGSCGCGHPDCRM